MATITNPPPAESSGGPTAPVQDPPAYERFIEVQLRRTRRQVRAVDLASSLLVLAAGLLGYVLVLLVVDHWLVPGGLAAWMRVLVWLAAVGGGLAWISVCIWPLVVRSINPVFAARVIERSEPGLKNSLVNFLLLRRRPEVLPPIVYHAVGEQAAERLAVVPIETVVDRTRVIRLLWIVLGVFMALAAAAIGLLIEGAAPNHLFRSVGRVVLPWAEIAPPTRVTISELQPGNTSVYQGERVRVSALVRGLREGEQVILHYSTADGQVLDQHIAMQRPTGSHRHQADLPPTGPGLVQDVTYWITAGDAVSEAHQVRALTAPAIVVDRVEYRYPRYTELEPRSVVRQGDIHGIEGTLVTVHATANQEIKTAMLDFECDGRRDLTMRAEGRTAWVQFRLSWEEAAGRPQHTSYQLRFTNAQGHENPQPVRYKIDCFRDEPPAVSFEMPDTPADRELVLELGRALPLVVAAADADYKLSSLLVRFERAGELVHEEPLLIDGPRAGEYRRSWLFQSSRYNLNAGDVVQFWAEARDNRQPDDDRPPDPNVSATPKYTLRILPRPPQEQAQDQPQDQPQQQEQRPPQDRERGRQGAKRPDRPQPDQPQQGEPQADQPQQGDPQAQPPGNDGQANAPRRPGQNPQPPAQAKDTPQQPQPADDQPQNDANQKDQPQQGGEPPMQGQPQGQPNADEQGEAAGERQDANGQGAQGDPSRHILQDRQPPKDQPGQAHDQPSPQKKPKEPIDPDSDPGRAIEEILKHRQEHKQGQDQSPNEQASERQPQQGERQSGQPQGQPQQNQPQQSEQQTGQSQQGEKQGAQPQQGQPSQQMPAGEGPQPANEQPAAQQAEGQQPAGQQPTGQQSAKQQPGPEQTATKQPAGANGNDGQSPGQDSPTQGQPGEQPADAPQPGQNMQPGHAAGDEQTATDSPEKQAGDKQGAKPPPSSSSGSKGKASPKAGGRSQPGDAPEQDGETPSPGEPGDQPDSQPAQAAREGDDQTKPPQAGKQRPGKGGDAQGSGQRPDRPEGDNQDSQEPIGKEPMGSDSESPDRGTAGAARRGRQPEGSPAPQEGNFDKQKHPDEQEQPSDAQEEGQSPSTSRRQSDSEGGQAGDRSGAGGQGGGQRSPSQGTGSAGQNTASDDGGGQANQKGQGPTAESGGESATSGESQDGSGAKVRRPGGKKQAGGQKGSAQPRAGQAGGEQPGPGRSGSRREGDRQPGDNPPPGPEKQPNEAGPEAQGQANAEDQASEQQPSQDEQERAGEQQGADQESDGGQGGGAGQPGGQPGDGAASQAGGGGQSGGQAGNAPPPAVPMGDDPNLDYARQATDLALEYLKDQLAKEEPDPDLLERLGWTREDMQRFVDRWEALKRAADQPGEEGKQAQVELDEMLRSLGLRPRGAALVGGTGDGTRISNTREGARSDPPSAYAEKYRAFTRGKKRRAEKKH